MQPIATAAKRFIVKGINDDESTCQCCGKEGLARVVWIEDTETGELRHFGTTCATAPAKGFQLDREISKAVRDHTNALKEAARAAQQEAVNKELDICYANKMALYLSRGGTYRESTAINGRVFTVPANSELMAICHAEAYPQKPARRWMKCA